MAARLPARTLTLLTAAALMTACSSSKSSAPTTENTTTVVAPTTTMAGTTTTETTTPAVTTSTTVAATTTAPIVPTTSATTAAPGGCGSSVGPSAAAVGMKQVSGDWNGDGTVDAARSWGEPSGGSPTWYVRMEVSGGSSSTLVLSGVDPGFAAVLGAVDVDFSIGAPPGVVRDELLAIVGSNAAGYNLGVFGVGADGCAFQFDDGAGQPYLVPVHGAAAVMSGMRCDGGMGSHFIVRLEAETSDGTHWTTRTIKVERTDANTLADGTVLTGTLLSTDPELAAFGEAECFGTPFVGGDADY